MINLVIITGISGAGKSTALKAFEDLGYLAVDNFPIRLLTQFLEEIEVSLDTKKVALVMDLRDKFFLKEYFNTINKIKDKVYLEVIFLTAKPDVIVTRYNQTRRTHPFLEKKNSLLEAINFEISLLKEIKECADLVIDTSNFNMHQLRYKIFEIYKVKDDFGKILLHFIAFGYKYGIPQEVDYLFDVRWLPNPYFEPNLKELTGRDKLVKEYILNCKQTETYIEFLKKIINWVVPWHIKEGRRYISVGIGCTGGKHRSPAIVDILKERLSSELKDVKLVITYRDIDKKE